MKKSPLSNGWTLYLPVTPEELDTGAPPYMEYEHWQVHYASGWLVTMSDQEADTPHVPIATMEAFIRACREWEESQR